MTAPKTITARLWEAISAGDVSEAERLVLENPGQIDAHIPFAGGTFLHLAASMPSLEMVKRLVDLGFDMNRASSLEGETPLSVACCYGHCDIARYLLNGGATMDTSTSATNPLFGAIIGRSADTARLLLERGIDSAVRYTSETMRGMDAMSFALERGERDIAFLIAEQVAAGDKDRAAMLLDEAAQIARLNNSTRH